MRLVCWGTIASSGSLESQADSWLSGMSFIMMRRARAGMAIAAGSAVLLFATSAWSQGLTPEAAIAKMTVPDGFEVTVVASEPLVRQPVTIEFDDRGHLWVIQYLQYPNPNGLQRVTVDRFSRTKYDRIPEPPPKGPRGTDRITILEDTDGDGRMDASDDFVDGLNLATGLAFGHGGVYVLNVPYLLFYPDRDRNDIPDGHPEVLLSGFGMEDAHSVANSLTWGPDGWLYGCQGSTVTANIRGIEFQQGVWRYHPVTKKFELFCEGGGNAWGLDFDRTGRLFYSTNYGGFVMCHGVPGGYYVKSFGKHGALHNPHAYGYFEHVPHQNFRGGHVTVGGIVYQGDAFPESFRGKYIAGDLLGHGVYWHDIQPRGSTVQTAHGGELLVANDPWFAPTDITMGPDGAIYVADWHDARTAHPDPDADWDRSNGRIYRIAPKKTEYAPPRHTPPIDLANFTNDELAENLAHRNQWYVRRARQELARRSPPMNFHERKRLIDGFLTTALTDVDETAALERLWALHNLGGLDERKIEKLLESPHAAVRAWTVRFLGEERVTHEMAHRLDEFAEREPDITVRQELACLARRLPAAQAMPIINANINRDVDVDDPYLPLLWWWAMEQHSVSGREEVMKRFTRPTLWKSKLGRDFLLPRLVRRYTAEGTFQGIDCVTALLQAAPDAKSRHALWEPILNGWNEQPRDVQTDEWRRLVGQVNPFGHKWWLDWSQDQPDIALLSVGVAIRNPSALRFAKSQAFDSKVDTPVRTSMLTLLATSGDGDLVEATLDLIRTEKREEILISAATLLGQFNNDRIAPQLLKLHQTSSPAVQSRIRDILLSKAELAKPWLTAVDEGKIPVAATPVEQIRRVALLEDKGLDALVIKHWGKLDGATREEKLAEVRRLNNDLRASRGDPILGQQHFKKHCAACHQLFGEGTKVGPDLTTANRQDRDFLLVSLVDPSSVIRKEYVSVVIQTRNGRIVTGLPIERTDSAIVLADSRGERQTINMTEIEELHDSPISLMPENLYKQFPPQDLRDLFAYLQTQK